MITKQTIEEVTHRLIKAYNPLAIYLFGSYAWGFPSDDSDLDLLIIIEKSDKKTYERPIAAYDALFGMGISKDILVYTKDEFDKYSHSTTSLCFKIKHDGELLYARS